MRSPCFRQIRLRWGNSRKFLKWNFVNEEKTLRKFPAVVETDSVGNIFSQQKKYIPISLNRWSQFFLFYISGLRPIYDTLIVSSIELIYSLEFSWFYLIVISSKSLIQVLNWKIYWHGNLNNVRGEKETFRNYIRIHLLKFIMNFQCKNQQERERKLFNANINPSWYKIIIYFSCMPDICNHLKLH